MYRVNRMARRRKYTISQIGIWLYQKLFILVLFFLFGALGFFLSTASVRHNQSWEVDACLRNNNIYPVSGWSNETDDAEDRGVWYVSDVKVKATGLFDPEFSAKVLFEGTPPFPKFGNMTTVAEECGVNDIALQLVPTYRYTDLLS